MVTPPQAPLQEEKKPERSEAEKAAFSLKKNAERAIELGIDPAEVLGLKQLGVDDEIPEDKPLTLRDLENLKKKEAKATSLQMADQLPEDERADVKEALSHVVPSGDAEKDLRFARAAVNAERNAKIAEMLGQRGKPRSTAAGGSADLSQGEDFTPTAAEEALMRPPYNLSKEKILKARGK